MLKALHILFTALLIYIAWLQVNDPDPLFWASLYLLAALVPLSQLINKTFSARLFLYGIAAGYCIAGVAMVFSGALGYIEHIGQESIIQDMSPDKPYIEETRELLGTFFTLAVIFGYSWVDLKKNK